ncbi:FAD linked oxidase N-terminal [Penicillium robsamsonii]|uniref:FAD linked oxidase N-terminal n=1 Tax=Penicillium robsamsonii TaxID=1792511 RepID=UPI002546C83E|nr:FAD linked oxidase N-terminal [Penicillium robsamsonii]KAJ5826500.1 FAD linked oxidase N-terminal [Penicillium robsamsonii]
MPTTVADAKVTEPSGNFSILASRLISVRFSTAPQTIDELVEGVIQGIATARSQLGLTGTQIVLETPVSNLDKNQMSSAHPAWRNAMWRAIHVGEWAEPLEADKQASVAGPFLQILKPLKRLSPVGGTYFNEVHYLEPDWEQTYFGSNYPRLLETKNKYDLAHMLDCWKCVGRRGEHKFSDQLGRKKLTRTAAKPIILLLLAVSTHLSL